MFFKNTRKNYVQQTVFILTENDLLCNKPFGFQKPDFTDYAIVHLAHQIHGMFNKNIYILGVFIDLPKTFDIADHKILSKKFHTLCNEK